jgi:hypothetical protein
MSSGLVTVELVSAMAMPGHILLCPGRPVKGC